MKFIFEVTMKPGFTVEEYAEGWVKASEIIQQTPGARGTYLHRKIGEPNKVLAIAHWNSKEARDAKDDDRSATVKAIMEKHARHCDIEVIGEFEEPEWEVIPKPVG
ncbi:antibiotic biosynthesis monooxygenase [Proteobacteria bacterium 005FR1]|nr:antibiotic biosynthesis monooxygenase [Proteobacteria bacterium 005FR1]